MPVVQMSTVGFALETHYNRKKFLLFLFYLIIIKNGFERGTIRLRLGGSGLLMLVRAVLRGNRMPPSQYCDECSYVNLAIWAGLISNL